MDEYSLLSDRLEYDAHHGVLRHRYSSSRRAIGDEAGYLNDQGYRIICINKQDYRAHRLAWLLYYGRWPHGDIDHINGNRHDNRISNLRECTRTQNLMNMACADRKNNKSGIKGVHWCSTHHKWVARIGVDGKRKTIGYFSSKEGAFEARTEFASKKYGKFARHE